MELSGERRINATKEKVWAALNDPAILRSCIPGCESLEKISETEMRLAGNGFVGKISLSDLDPPNGTTVSVQGQGDSGPVEGSGRVTLLDDAGGTKLSYTVNTNAVRADQGHDAADAFLARLTAAIASTPAATNVITEKSVYHLAHEDHDHDPSNPHYFGLPVGVILAAIVACISVGIVLTKFFIID